MFFDLLVTNFNFYHDNQIILPMSKENDTARSLYIDF